MASSPSDETEARDVEFALVVQRTGQHLPLRRSDETSLGRDATNDVVLAQPSISRQHARFRVDGMTVSVRDCGSTNGTKVDGHPVGSAFTPIRPGSLLQLGDEALEVAVRRSRPLGTRQPASADAAATKGPSEGRTSRWVAIVVAATAVVGTIVGLLTYLQSRPSPVEAYRAEVLTVCKSAAVRQVKIDAAVTANGYDRKAYTDLAQQVPEADASLVTELRKLNPPDEVAAKHDETIGYLQQAIKLERDYVASLPSLPSSEFAKRWPQLPGDTRAMNGVLQQARTSLVALSGGQCEINKP